MAAITTIIPVAGGKGGIGKTFITANLALALARQGHSTIVADLDLGGSNLHTFLGLPNKYPGIGDHLQESGSRLTEYLVPITGLPLLFLPGDGRTPFLANITWHQKESIIKQLRKFQAEFLLLDLGAGTAFNTLDFFAMAGRGLLITTPEPPAVVSLLAFLKNFIFRVLEKETGKDFQLRERLHDLSRQTMQSESLSLERILVELSVLDPGVAARFNPLLAAFRPWILFNQGFHPEDLELAVQIREKLHMSLSLEADFLGFIFDDAVVREAVRSRQALLLEFPGSLVAGIFGKIAGRVVRYWPHAMPESLERLRIHTGKVFQEYQNTGNPPETTQPAGPA